MQEQDSNREDERLEGESARGREIRDLV